MLSVAAEIPFARAAKIITGLTWMATSGSSLQRLVQDYGGRVVEQQATEAEAMVKPPPKFDEARFRQAPEPDSAVMAVSMDGAMVNVRGEGWKEVKTVAISAWSPTLRRSGRRRATNPGSP